MLRLQTCASLFSGGGGWEALQSLKRLWSVELEPWVAEVAQRNAPPGHVEYVGSIEHFDPHAMARPDVLFASPPCQRHSQSQMRPGVRANSCDASADIGRDVLRYVAVLRPALLLVENATSYARHPSFRALADGVQRLGYSTDLRLLRADDYGVPQTRTRMFFRAWLGGNTPPWPREQATPAAWGPALQDLLDSFPASRLAPWQRERLERQQRHEDFGGMPILVSSNNASTPRFRSGKVVRVGHRWDEPGFTVVKTYAAMSQTRVVFPDGRVVAVTPRGFARMQTFPDTYLLPADPAAATHVVGNAVPPLLARQLVEAARGR
jgi:DNA (cytosine-5)-methyltransferase 1